jgi:hypothetical protein
MPRKVIDQSIIVPNFSSFSLLFAIDLLLHNTVYT